MAENGVKTQKRVKVYIVKYIQQNVGCTQHFSLKDKKKKYTYFFTF